MKKTERYLCVKAALLEDVAKNDGSGTYTCLLFTLPNDYEYRVFPRGNEKIEILKMIRSYDIEGHIHDIGGSIKKLNEE